MLLRSCELLVRVVSVSVFGVSCFFVDRLRLTTKTSGDGGRHVHPSAEGQTSINVSRPTSTY